MCCLSRGSVLPTFGCTVDQRTADVPTAATWISFHSILDILFHVIFTFRHGEGAAACKATLAMECVAKPSSWNKMVLYNIPGGGSGVSAEGFTDYTAEFLLTRGPYAILG
jgi:hypothetical protein